MLSPRKQTWLAFTKFLTSTTYLTTCGVRLTGPVDVMADAQWNDRGTCSFRKLFGGRLLALLRRRSARPGPEHARLDCFLALSWVWGSLCCIVSINFCRFLSLSTACANNSTLAYLFSSITMSRRIIARS